MEIIVRLLQYFTTVLQLKLEYVEDLIRSADNTEWPSNILRDFENLRKEVDDIIKLCHWYKVSILIKGTLYFDVLTNNLMKKISFRFKCLVALNSV